MSFPSGLLLSSCWRCRIFSIIAPTSPTLPSNNFYSPSLTEFRKKSQIMRTQFLCARIIFTLSKQDSWVNKETGLSRRVSSVKKFKPFKKIIQCQNISALSNSASCLQNFYPNFQRRRRGSLGLLSPSLASTNPSPAWNILKYFGIFLIISKYLLVFILHFGSTTLPQDWKFAYCTTYWNRIHEFLKKRVIFRDLQVPVLLADLGCCQAGKRNPICFVCKEI